MTAYDLNRATTTVGFAGALSRFVAMFSEWNDARVTRKALSKLSDRELDDIGLSRSDIDTLVARA